MKYLLNPKCKNCNCKSLVTETFCNVSYLEENDQFWQCIADVEKECLEGEPINILKEVK